MSIENTNNNANVQTDKNEQPILTDDFKFYNKSACRLKCSLYANRFEILVQEANKSKKLVVNLSDIVGSKIGQGRNKADKSAYLIIYVYSSSNKSEKKTYEKRKRHVFELECAKFNENLDENLQYINKWHLKLDELIKQENLNRYLNNNNNNNNNINNDEDLYRSRLNKPFLILVNPRAGAGKAKNIYYEHILPVMAEANLNTNKVIFTSHSGHAREIAKSVKLDEYRGVLIVSGDGLIYETINGFMDRADWREALRLPIGHIPGGSANAVACCVSYLTREAFSGLSLEAFARNATFNLIKSIQMPLDLAVYEQANQKYYTSCLSFEWAIIADVDLESEKYRYLGGLRFLVGALKRIMKLRVYRGRLSFLPSDSQHVYKPKSSNINVTQFNQILDLNNNDTSIQNKEPTSKFKYLRPLNEKVPPDWVTIDDSFVLFLVTQLPLIAPDFLASKEASLNDGCMHLAFIKEGITKTELLSLFNLTESGEHLSHPLVEYVKVKAFRLEPNNEAREGVIMIDGERVPCEPIQAELIPSMATILANMKD